MAEEEFIPSIGPIKDKIIAGIIRKYKSEIIETTLEFTQDIKDAIEVSIKVAA